MIERLYRLATADEIAFATYVLYPLQDQVLEIAAIFGDALYLTGGTALARCYFQHRLSDDLDFFTTTGDLKRIAADFIARLVDAGFQVGTSQLDHCRRANHLPLPTRTALEQALTALT